MKVDFYAREIELDSMALVEYRHQLINENDFNRRWWINQQIQLITQKIARLTKIVEERNERSLKQ